MIKFVTDSGADIAPQEAEKKGIALVQLSVTFAGSAYDMAADRDYATFYQRLKNEKAFPTTSQPPPEAFMVPFRAAREAGDTVVAVLISGGLSGTYQSAQIAKDAVGYDDIHLIDSRSAIMGQRLLLEHGMQLRDAGADAAGIVATLEGLAPRVQVYGMIDTLTYLHKGGRLSKAKALAGNLLHIRPLVTLAKGVIAIAGRGRNYNALLNPMEEKGLDPAYPVYFGYTADKAKALQAMQHALGQFHMAKTGLFPVGPVIGAHVGPGAMALAFVQKND